MHYKIFPLIQPSEKFQSKKLTELQSKHQLFKSDYLKSKNFNQKLPSLFKISETIFLK